MTEDEWAEKLLGTKPEILTVADLAAEALRVYRDARAAAGAEFDTLSAMRLASILKVICDIKQAAIIDQVAEIERMLKEQQARQKGGRK